MRDFDPTLILYVIGIVALTVLLFYVPFRLNRPPTKERRSAQESNAFSAVVPAQTPVTTVPNTHVVPAQTTDFVVQKLIRSVEP
jgi:hypothetical protein